MKISAGFLKITDAIINNLQLIPQLYNPLKWLIDKNFTTKKITDSLNHSWLVSLQYNKKQTHIHHILPIRSALPNRSAPINNCHYLSQCWDIVDWNPRNKLQWNFNCNSYIFIQENPFENVVCKMASILPRPQWINRMAWHDMLKHKTWALIQYEDIVLVQELIITLWR